MIIKKWTVDEKNYIRLDTANKKAGYPVSVHPNPVCSRYFFLKFFSALPYFLAYRSPSPKVEIYYKKNIYIPVSWAT